MPAVGGAIEKFHFLGPHKSSRSYNWWSDKSSRSV